MPADFISRPGGSPVVIPQDGHGKAALLLVESLIHTLVGRDGLTAEEAIELIDVAVDAEREINDPGAANGFAALPSPLTPIVTSLRQEFGR